MAGRTTLTRLTRQRRFFSTPSNNTLFLGKENRSENPTTLLFPRWTRSSSVPLMSTRSPRRIRCKCSWHSFDDMIRTSLWGCSSPWNHPLLIPSYFALLSIVVLVAQAIFSSGPVRRLCGKDVPAAGTHSEAGAATRTGFVSAIKDHMEHSGGSIIFLFQLTRLVAVLTLLSLAIFSFVQDEAQQQHISPSSALSAFRKHWGKKHKGKHRNGNSLTKREWLDLTLCLTYVRHRCSFLG